MKRIGWVIIGLLLSFSLIAAPSWEQWLAGLKQDALAEGIPSSFFDQTFAGIQPNQQVKHLSRTQPERRLTYMEYRNSRITAYRVSLGQQKYKKHQHLFSKIGDHYGVDPCYVAAIWGLETSYGHYMGNFPVIRSLATLAYRGERTDYFRKELLYALHILYEEHVQPSQFKGEWAGASGHPQFMPSSWHQYAEDFNGDGKKDIWNNYDDALASIANYLKQKGWESGEPVRLQVTVRHAIPEDEMSLKYQLPVSEWSARGVSTVSGGRLPYQHLEASLVEPYGGPNFLVFKNFRVLMRYNNSIYYAGSLAHLADRICRR